jgi:aspartate racemase
MKIAGIIGGIAPDSTIEYYRFIIDSYREQRSDGSYPSIIINSIDMTKMRGLIEAGQLAELTDYLAGEIQRLERAGADFALMASNTPHIVFDEVRRRSNIPLLSIIEATCEEAKVLGMKKLGLFGTRFTMHGGFYAELFSREGMTIVLPDEDEQAYIHDRYMSELVRGRFLPETRERLLAIADGLKTRAGIEGLILGGTELPLILRDAANPGMPFLDTTRIHVKRVVAELLS